MTPVRDALARDKQPAAKPAEVAPRGQREVKDITYGNWRKLCFKAAGAPTLCRTSITGTFPTGQVAVRLDLIERDDGRNKRLQVFVPVGMYLQHPVKLTVDQGNSYQVPYTWCLSNACIAADVADPNIIKDMEAGKALLLEVVDSNLLSLTTSLPLTQFASVHKGAPEQTLEQDIDE
ncbi:invasion associated locus B family protein [Bradyrhizobium sp. 5.13L]